MKVAYLCEPQFGGTYTFFRRVRPRLAAHGVDLRCVPPYSVGTFRGSPFEGAEGVDFLELPLEWSAPGALAAATKVMVEHLEREGYEAVIILPGCDILTTNIASYLPRRLRCAARVSLMARGAYAPTRVVADHLNAVVAVSHRVGHDLESAYGMPREILHIIYNGAELRPPRERPGPAGRPLRVIYSGRLTDLDKGTLQLPVILRKARAEGADLFMTIIGEGPEAGRLREAFRREQVADRAELLGTLPLGEVERRLKEADVFILPSRLEACPNALLEAMAAGCTPAAFRIHDSVDRIVEDRISGLLAPVGNTTALAKVLVRLARDRALCARMGEAARQRIEQYFTSEQTAEQYAAVLRAMMKEADRRPAARSLARYQIPRGLKPTWRTRIPAPLKNLARKWLERFGRSS